MASPVRRIVLGSLLLLIATASRALQSQASGIEALKKLSILELSEVEVTSVSRMEESLGSAAAAIAVVTAEDLRRTGATTIPEALRGLPGIFVGQRNSSSWAISSRGFSSVSSEKLLVLSDTRSIYTPLFSGVQWDVQNYIMEDIERIEVICGPGATQWGSNAVNGVINITTKSARDTQGLYLAAGGGTEEQAAVSARYGGELGSTGHFRVSGQYFDRDASQLASPASPDDWHMAHTGFRADFAAGPRDAVTMQGDWYRGRIGLVGPAVTIIGRPGPLPPLRTSVSGGNLLARWQRSFAAGSNIQLRAYYDRTHRNDPSFSDELDTIDLDFQHHLALASQQLTWGLGYRHTSNTNIGKGVFAVDPPRARDQLFSGFVQDQIAFGESLRLTLGTKLEHNDFSGFEYQPGIRLGLGLPHAQNLWMAVSRAVRVPTRLERDVSIEVTPPGADPAAFLLGNRDFDAERLLAWELGYRWQHSARLALDVATFFNQYKGLASLELGEPFTDAANRTVYPISNENLTDGRALGAEALVELLPVENWRLIVSYSYLDLNIDPRGQDNNRGQFADGATPRHQFGLRSAIDLGPVRIDAFLRHLTDIRREPQIVTGEGIAGYTELDLRVSGDWRQLELALKLRNLLHEDHLEFGAPTHRGGIERSAFASVTWRR
jgi:iron complex outermembrane recepter protein